MGDDLSYGLNTLGPLCLWQCFYLNIVWKHKCLIQVSWQQVNGKGIIVKIVNRQRVNQKWVNWQWIN